MPTNAGHPSPSENRKIVQTKVLRGCAVRKIAETKILTRKIAETQGLGGQRVWHWQRTLVMCDLHYFILNTDMSINIQYE
jgi:hypothetical protein